jgi:hypothetical protein
MGADRPAEYPVAVWQLDQQLHLSRSHSALPAGPVGDDQLMPKLAEIVD